MGGDGGGGGVVIVYAFICLIIWQLKHGLCFSLRNSNSMWPLWYLNFHTEGLLLENARTNELSSTMRMLEG